MEKQHTLAGPVRLQGTGLHTGKEVNLVIQPAPEGHGFTFCRTDLEGRPVIAAEVDNVVDTSRGTPIV
jgi:UDP-3-O-[3-hydroxymyristoyl] N-acetylglucosamine deacetylase/3-hydroxyacyl-[acyl-carrier-protein] dehydratase